VSGGEKYIIVGSVCFDRRLLGLSKAMPPSPACGIEAKRVLVELYITCILAKIMPPCPLELP
jgi:hypothetical protein